MLLKLDQVWNNIVKLFKEINIKKIGTYLLATVLLPSLVPCAPKCYKHKHSPVGSSSVQKSSGEAQEKENMEEVKSD